MKILRLTIIILIATSSMNSLNLLRRISPCLSRILDSGRCLISERRSRRSTERENDTDNDTDNGRLLRAPSPRTRRSSTVDRDSEKEKDITIRRKKDYRLSGNLSVESKDRRRISTESGLFRAGNGSNRIDVDDNRSDRRDNGRRGRYVFIEDDGRENVLRGGRRFEDRIEDGFVDKIVDKVKNDIRNDDISDSNGSRIIRDNDIRDNDRRDNDRRDNDRRVNDRNNQNDDMNDLPGFRGSNRGEDQVDNSNNRNGSRISRLLRTFRRGGSLLDRLKKYKNLGSILVGNSIN